MRDHRRLIIFSGVVVLLPLVCIGILYTTGLSYLYCCFRERQWLASTNEAQLDNRVAAFYTKRAISPSESMWGRHYSLKPGERMVQYLIFGKEPLDAVFDSGSRVVCIYTSYE
ncbi:MAG: hypothetical protein K8R23_01970 [Chthoniobacter sp.]|nr:hypothetical protein [Chthoniobacter sp.]